MSGCVLIAWLLIVLVVLIEYELAVDGYTIHCMHYIHYTDCMPTDCTLVAYC